MNKGKINERMQKLEASHGRMASALTLEKSAHKRLGIAYAAEAKTNQALLIRQQEQISELADATAVEMERLSTIRGLRMENKLLTDILTTDQNKWWRRAWRWITRRNVPRVERMSEPVTEGQA